MGRSPVSPSNRTMYWGSNNWSVPSGSTSDSGGKNVITPSLPQRLLVASGLLAGTRTRWPTAKLGIVQPPPRRPRPRLAIEANPSVIPRPFQSAKPRALVHRCTADLASRSRYRSVSVVSVVNQCSGGSSRWSTGQADRRSQREKVGGSNRAKPLAALPLADWRCSPSSCRWPGPSQDREW